MDPAGNPFAPGAGTPPPQLTGRDSLLGAAELAVSRIKAGRHAKSQLLLGLRGVGKTVLLNAIARMAVERGFIAIAVEAPEDRRLAELLVPPLRRELFRLDGVAGAKESVRRAMGALRAFAAAFRVKVGDVEFGVEPATGTADSGDLDFDLAELLQLVADAVRRAQQPLALFVDEVQYLSEADLRALIVALHRASQAQVPIILFGAGLPQLAGLAGEAKSYAERLFDYPEVGSLPNDAAAAAIEEPLEAEGVRITKDALQEILNQTDGYPYFLQEWGSKAWDAAPSSPIHIAAAKQATIDALAQLDRGFFRVRWDRLTPRERDYLRAMAELGPGPHRSGAIADILGVSVTSAGPLRNALIGKGMIFSQQHGETAFTVPLFDQFLKRTDPEWEPTAVTPRRKVKRPRRKR
ncbi:MAG: AAA family ATPase [Gemmatimonadaceae bacterium]